jgi:hypothetical protein
LLVAPRRTASGIPLLSRAGSTQLRNVPRLPRVARRSPRAAVLDRAERSPPNTGVQRSGRGPHRKRDAADPARRARPCPASGRWAPAGELRGRLPMRRGSALVRTPRRAGTSPVSRRGRMQKDHVVAIAGMRPRPAPRSHASRYRGVPGGTSRALGGAHDLRPCARSSCATRRSCSAAGGVTRPVLEEDVDDVAESALAAVIAKRDPPSAGRRVA